MNRIGVLFFSLISAVALLVGCGGGGSAPQAPQGEVYAQEYVGGVLKAWPSALLNGMTASGQYNCENNSPCTTSITNAYTNSSGDYTLQSWAIPGTWNIAAAADDTCSTGGSSDGQWSAGVPFEITCGQIVGDVITASPNNCTIWIWTDRPSTTNCPSAVTLTITNTTFPTGHALNVSTYSDTAQNLASHSISASSSTQMTVPFADVGVVVGDNVLVVVDPTTNRAVGAVLFTLHQIYTGKP